jgi:hypothetical protein
MVGKKPSRGGLLVGENKKALTEPIVPASTVVNTMKNFN